MRRAERDGADRRASATVESAARLAARSAAVTSTTSAGSRPPSAVARSGASGVMPTAWKSATDPLDAATAPNAFRSSSVSAGGRPTMTGIALPARAPTSAPTATASASPGHAATSGGRVEDDLAAPVLRHMQPDVGHAAGERGGKVGEVAVAVGARADHRIGEGDGVRFAPRDLLAQVRAEQRLVGRAGEGRDAADLLVKLHQPRPVARCGPSAAEQLRMDQVHGADVERGRHGDAAAEARDVLDEIEVRLAVQDDAVDMSAG